VDATQIGALNVRVDDRPTDVYPDGSEIEFTLFWNEAQRWERVNYSVAVHEPKHGNAGDADKSQNNFAGQESVAELR